MPISLGRAAIIVLAAASIVWCSPLSGQWRVGAEVGASRFWGGSRNTDGSQTSFRPYRPTTFGVGLERQTGRYAAGVQLHYAEASLALEGPEAVVCGGGCLYHRQRLARAGGSTGGAGAGQSAPAPCRPAVRDLGHHRPGVAHPCRGAGFRLAGCTAGGTLRRSRARGRRGNPLALTRKESSTWGAAPQRMTFERSGGGASPWGCGTGYSSWIWRWPSTLGRHLPAAPVAVPAVRAQLCPTAVTHGREASRRPQVEQNRASARDRGRTDHKPGVGPMHLREARGGVRRCCSRSGAKRAHSGGNQGFDVVGHRPLGSSRSASTASAVYLALRNS